MSNEDHPIAGDGTLASDDEALRLAVAFYCIVEPGKRKNIRAFAECLAADAQTRSVTNVDGVEGSLGSQSRRPLNAENGGEPRDSRRSTNF